jgi:hypothetical protein
MIGMLTKNEPQPYFTGEAKPDAITENSTQFICIRTADDALTFSHLMTCIYVVPHR